MKGLFFYDKFSLPFPTALLGGKAARSNNPIGFSLLKFPPNFHQILNEIKNQ